MTQQTPEPLFGSRFLDIQDEAVPIDYSPRLLRAVDIAPEPTPAPRFALPGLTDEPVAAARPVFGARMIAEPEHPLDEPSLAATRFVESERLVAAQPARAMAEPFAARLGAEPQRLVAARPARAAAEPWAATRVLAEPQRLAAPQPVVVAATAVALAAEPVLEPAVEPIVLLVEPIEVAPARAIIEPVEDSEPVEAEREPAEPIELELAREPEPVEADVVDEVAMVAEADAVAEPIEAALVAEPIEAALVAESAPAAVAEPVLPAFAEPVLAPEPAEFPEPVLAPEPLEFSEPVAWELLLSDEPLFAEPEPAVEDSVVETEPVVAPAAPEPVSSLPVAAEPVAPLPWLASPAPAAAPTYRAVDGFPNPAEYASRWAAASPVSPAAPNVPAPAHTRRLFRRGIDRSRLTR